MEQQTLGVWRLLSDAGGYFKRHWKLALLTLIGFCVAWAIHPVAAFAVLCGSQYALTYSILSDRNLLSGDYGWRRFLAVLGLQVALWVIFAIGWTLLILPGVYLMLRRYFAVPALIAGEARIVDAMAISWRRTARQEWALLGATTIAAAVPMLLMAATVIVVWSDGGVAAIAITFLSALIAGGLFPIFCSCIAAAGYAGAGGETYRLEQVFS